LHTISDLYKLFGLGPSQQSTSGRDGFSKVSEQVKADANDLADLLLDHVKNYCKNNFKYGRKKPLTFRMANLICIAPTKP